MIKENIEKIKKAEEESERIIKNAEIAVKERFNSIELEIDKLKKEYEKKMEEELKEYMSLKIKEKDEKIKNLQNQNEIIKEKIKEKEKKIEQTAEKIWKEILNELYRNNSISS
ncbi:MAG: hypothetical protein NC915_02990 [Candidatus Omnitrophica bacterium]|nr:hypothetical protein [Candidatus Omnitrophota bacterium]